jgi:hypothetical protein
VLVASHELDRARALAHREVQVVAGRVHGGVAPPAASVAPGPAPAPVPPDPAEVVG